jgi:hypothetical protein
MTFPCRFLTLVTLLATSFLLPVEAQAQKKGGSTPKPLTYLIRWFPRGTQIIDVNNHTDLLGSHSVDGVVINQIHVDGVAYAIDALINDSNWVTTGLIDLSNRDSDDSFYVIASGRDQGVGVRRRFKFAVPGTGGAPQLTGTYTLPARHFVTNVNAFGELVGNYNQVAGAPYTAFHISTDGIVTLLGPAATSPKISDTGFVVYYSQIAATGAEGFQRWNSVTGATAWFDTLRMAEVFAVDDLGDFSGWRHVINMKGGGWNARKGFTCTSGRFTNFSKTNGIWINNRNEAVGNSDTLLGITYYYDGATGTTFQIWDLIDQTLNTAEDITRFQYGYPTVAGINDDGVVFGSAEFDDFLLIPIRP